MATISPWTQHFTKEGRPYYYNSVTKASHWEKPIDFVAPKKWKEFKTTSGQTYYHNTETNESVWQKPADFDEAIFAPANGTGQQPSAPQTLQEDNNKESEIEMAMKATLASFPGSTLGQDPSGDVDLTGINVPVYKTRAEMAEGLRRLFKEKNIPGNATWEMALKAIWNDPRYEPLRSFNEKKQIFNVYKTQKQKEEREEQRIRFKKAKEDLEKFILQHPKIYSTMSYARVDSMLSDCPEWKGVPDRDRRIIFSDVANELAKKEKEETKALRKRNIEVFQRILEDMPDITHETTWNKAQPMFLENKAFTEDLDLQSLDREDALITFQDHIRSLEKSHQEDKDRERRRQKRIQRKNREAFVVLLEELQENKILDSRSMWKELYAIIKNDDRFGKMLLQRGSTPLDLFKFFIQEIKDRIPNDRKIIKEVLKDKNFEVEKDTKFSEFKEKIMDDERILSIDEGNVLTTFEYFRDKAINKEREKYKEELKAQKKLEAAFYQLLKDGPMKINSETTWEEVSQQYSEHEHYKAVNLESERIQVFKDFILREVIKKASSPVAESSSPTRKAEKRKADPLPEETGNEEGEHSSFSEAALSDSSSVEVSRKTHSKGKKKKSKNRHRSDDDKSPEKESTKKDSKKKKKKKNYSDEEASEEEEDRTHKKRRKKSKK